MLLVKTGYDTGFLIPDEHAPDVVKALASARVIRGNTYGEIKEVTLDKNQSIEMVICWPDINREENQDGA